MPRASYAITMRITVDPSDPDVLGRITSTVAGEGGVVTAVDLLEASQDAQIVDITANADGESHAGRVTDAVRGLDGAEVQRVSDRVLLAHLGGKIEVSSRVPLRTRDDLSIAYTPGVADVCRAIDERPEDARSLTIQANTIAIVTDGSAVLGLGDLGPAAALPVMEGKAVLFKRFAGVDAWPVCLDTHDVDEIVRTVELLASSYGGINLEDISAPRCFEVERRLRERLDIPVFHDDQHGTAIVVLAALVNALRLTGKQLSDVRVAMAGAGAAGIAVARLLLTEGVGELIAADSTGILHPGRDGLNDEKRWLADNTNQEGRTGDLRDALRGADVFIGVSGPDILQPADLDVMADGAIVFALANPVPEVDPDGAAKHAAIIATGRSDHPNQINNVLAFPGIFRGALDAAAPAITEQMEVAAAHAIANVIRDEELHPSYIIPSVFDPEVVPAVAAAVADATDGRGDHLISRYPPSR